jgi:hypothetical protein
LRTGGRCSRGPSIVALGESERLGQSRRILAHGESGNENGSEMRWVRGSDMNLLMWWRENEDGLGFEECCISGLMFLGWRMVGDSSGQCSDSTSDHLRSLEMALRTFLETPSLTFAVEPVFARKRTCSLGWCMEVMMQLGWKMLQ